MKSLEIRFYGKLRRYTENQDPKKPSIITTQVREGETIRDVLTRLGVDLEEVGTNIFLNGEYSSLTRIIEDDGRLGIFPDDMNLLYKWHFRKK